MSSKFAIPFFQKSPLYGAYTSGADAMVTTSVAPYFDKLQQDIGTAVSKSLMKPVDKCAQLDERLATNKIGIDAYNRSKKNCAEKEKQDYLESPKGEQDMRDQEISEIGEAAAKQASETLQGYSGKFDMMKSWGIAKKQKEEEAKKSMDTYFKDKEDRETYIESKK